MAEHSISPTPLDVPRCQIGASPIWDIERDELLWVDVMAGLVHRHRPAMTETRTHQLPSPVGCVVPRHGGGYIVGLEDGLWATDDAFGNLQHLGRFHDPAAGIRMNAGKADGAGRFWGGTMAYDLRPGAGALGRLDPDGELAVQVEDLGEANGLGWSPDEKLFYLVDSGIGVVDAFDFDAVAGTLADRRTVLRVPREEGLTDGMTVDAEGSIWLSLWDGWSVRRYAPDGTLQESIRFPVAQVTGCTFGGPDLRDLYVTTAAYQLSPEQTAEQPLAGSLFVLTPGPMGLPAGRYAGA